MIQLSRYIDEFYESVGTEGIREYQNFLNSISKGNLYRFNVNNQILIFRQNPQADLVATFASWKEEGYVLRKHSAIYADKEDGMTGSNYLFDAEAVVDLRQEKRESYNWKLTEENYEMVNYFFVHKLEKLQDTIKATSKECFRNLDILKDNEIAQELAENAANAVILGRCGFVYEFEKKTIDLFESLEGEQRKNLIKLIQPYVTQYSNTILANIGYIVRNSQIFINKMEVKGIESEQKSIKSGREEKVPGGNDRSGDGRNSGIGNNTGRAASKRTVSNDKKIEDFGEKIGGAKKDLWMSRGLNLSDLLNLNEAEKEKYVKKDQIWKKPDYEELKNSGYSKEDIYYLKYIRDALPLKPDTSSEKSMERYVKFISDVRDAALKGLETGQRSAVENHIVSDQYITNTGYRKAVKAEYSRLITTKLLKAFNLSNEFLRKEVMKKEFLYSDEDKIRKKYLVMKYDDNTVWCKRDIGKVMDCLKLKTATGFVYIYPSNGFENSELWKKDTYYVLNTRAHDVVNINFDTFESADQYLMECGMRELREEKNKENRVRTRKQKLVPEMLQHIHREGLADICQDREVTGQDFIDTYHIKGGEFGNWLNEKERQANLNMAYEAFYDLALALDMNEQDIALDGRLSIAFGARGSGNALAHYEPEREVINLTKMKGAGSLAHEWGHALDDIISKRAGGMTEDMKEVLQTLRYIDGKKTQYYQDAESLDHMAQKCDKGYWASECEMFARAFSCYVTDKLAEMGGKSDYLSGHSDRIHMEYNGKIVNGHPVGEERVIINQAIEKMLNHYKTLNLLHEPETHIMERKR